jgi:hypothetical protein
MYVRTITLQAEFFGSHKRFEALLFPRGQRMQCGLKTSRKHYKKRTGGALQYSFRLRVMTEKRDQSAPQLFDLYHMTV